MQTIPEAIAALRAAVAAVETAAGSIPFLEGHGIQSRRFRFAWRDDALSIDIDLPCERLLAGEDAQRADAAEIAAACRMGILLLAVREAGHLLNDGESTLEAVCNGNGTAYRIRDAEGEILDSGGDWEGLAARLESALPDSAPLSII